MRIATDPTGNRQRPGQQSGRFPTIPNDPIPDDADAVLRMLNSLPKMTAVDMSTNWTAGKEYNSQIARRMAQLRQKAAFLGMDVYAPSGKPFQMRPMSDAQRKSWESSPEGQKFLAQQNSSKPAPSTSQTPSTPPNPNQSFLPTDQTVPSDSNTARTGGNTPTTPAPPPARPGSGTDFTGSAKPPTKEKPSAPSKPGMKETPQLPFPGSGRPPIKPGYGIDHHGNLRPGFEMGANGRPRPIDYSNVPYNQRPLHAIPQNLQGFYQNSPTSPHYRPPLTESISILRPQSAPAPFTTSKPAPLNPRDMVYSPGANYKDDPMYSTREIERREHFESMRMDAAEQQGKKYEFQNQKQKAQFIAEGGSWDSKSKASGKHPFERLTSQEYGALNLAAQAGDKDAKRELDERYQRGQRYIMDSASAQTLLKLGSQKRDQQMAAIPKSSPPLDKLDQITQARDIHGNEIRTADMLVSGGVKLQKNQRAEKKPDSGLQFRNVGGQVKIVGGANKNAQRGPKTEVRNGKLYSDFGGQVGGRMGMVAAPKRESGMR